MINIKKDFIENRIYEKIDEEMKAIEENRTKLFSFEYHNLSGIDFV